MHSISLVKLRSNRHRTNQSSLAGRPGKSRLELCSPIFRSSQQYGTVRRCANGPLALSHYRSTTDGWRQSLRRFYQTVGTDLCRLVEKSRLHKIIALGGYWCARTFVTNPRTPIPFFGPCLLQHPYLVLICKDTTAWSAFTVYS